MPGLKNGAKLLKSQFLGGITIKENFNRTLNIFLEILKLLDPEPKNLMKR